MSPEPDKQIAATVISKENVAPKMDETNMSESQQSTSGTTITNILQTPISVINSRTPRERRIQSPSNYSAGTILDSISEPPVSPCSTSSADATFEPTIDMMVNDFDDEQTLNEEEALADQESHNPEDEIATLREESEMPIDELLAKYGAMQALEPPPRKKPKKHKKSKKRVDKETDEQEGNSVTPTNETTISANVAQKSDEYTSNSSVPVIKVSEIVDNEANTNVSNKVAHCSEEDDEDDDEDLHEETEINKIDHVNIMRDIKKPQQHRSHLLDLYPEGTFDSIVQCDHSKDALFAHLSGVDCEDIDDCAEEEDDAETDSDCFKKSVMVGPEYQAAIPEGLSQYGDVLPYENEDKLIWEPSQVSEREVEEYLLLARDIKPTMVDEDAPFEDEKDTIIKEKNQEVSIKVSDKAKVEKLSEENALVNSPELNGNEQNIVVKDNEQALHLLVQCGYDFKEALRRKRLNVLPLTGTMSLWSEEECQKFEEGIQKFGKDFLKIRQQLVRTRTMRELVQFYYLWKKSDRRDQNFANSDTVDHMDIYLNESTEYGPNNTAGGASNAASTTSTNSNRKNAGNHKNISIMAKNTVTANVTAQPAVSHSASAASPHTNSTKLVNNRRRISLQENSQKTDVAFETNAD